MSLEDLLKRAQFTPGPWKVSLPDETLVLTADREIVAACCDGYDDDPERKAADARLIAASPDMFEALLAARETLLNIGRPETNDRHHEVYQKIESALLRALISQKEGVE